MSKFQQADTRDSKTTDVWLTPRYILESLGDDFDLDPAYSPPRPLYTAKNYYGEEEDGLKQPWFGKVFCNPPYGRMTGKFAEKAKTHDNSILLTFARTETLWWHTHVWNSASAIFFFKGRLKFINSETLTVGDASPAPSVLIAYGNTMADKLTLLNIEGKCVRL